LPERCSISVPAVINNIYRSAVPATGSKIFAGTAFRHVPAPLHPCVDRVTVVKFRVNNRGSNGTGCFWTKVRIDTVEFMDMRIAGLRKWWDLIREGKIFIKDRTNVACRLSGIEWIVVYFRKLLFQTNNEKFNLGRVKNKICRHPGGNLFQSGLEVGNSWVKVVRVKREKSWVSSAKRWWLRGSEEMRVLSGVVWRKVEDQEQILEEHHRKKYARKRNLYHF